MAEFLLSLNPANWPESIPLRHTLEVRDVVSFRHTHVHEVMLRLDISDSTVQLARELRWMVIIGVLSFVAWKGIKRLYPPHMP
ncbi:hypothetical protein DRE_00495 [Drechslerella stenobrocha 248]|uniref:Uncharacterized protein n=1 Tax=Drechslerella stenobrocha 248 TaxID=1043628 RepID=W7I535_9PEZI|nr:hypothetical protein DRE_00495 [Drechslerella stenobrocha 248]